MPLLPQALQALQAPQVVFPHLGRRWAEEVELFGLEDLAALQLLVLFRRWGALVRRQHLGYRLAASVMHLELATRTMKRVLEQMPSAA